MRDLSKRAESDRAQSFASANETRRYYLTAKRPLPRLSQFAIFSEPHAARSAIMHGGVDHNGDLERRIYYILARPRRNARGHSCEESVTFIDGYRGAPTFPSEIPL